jgi:hypothetical protein
MKDPEMGSFYLASKVDDFDEHCTDVRQCSSGDIPFVVPANDNLPADVTLSVRCRGVLRRLMMLLSNRC